MTRWLFPGCLMSLLLVMAAGCGDAPEPAQSPPTTAPDATMGDPGPVPEGQSEPEPAAEGAPVEPSPADPTPTEASPDAGTPAEPAPPSAEEGSAAAFPGPEAEPVFAAADVSLQVLPWTGVEKIVAAHKGKVVVVDLWSTSCIPCRREFPNLVQLHKERGDRVACVSVSLDYVGIKSKPPEFYHVKVLELLQKWDARFDNVLCSDEADVVFNSLGVQAVPAVYVYGPDGKLVQRFADPQDGEEHTYAKDIRPLVEKLLAR